jgi:hypothetical protein
VPENCSDAHSRLLVVDLGHLIIKRDERCLRPSRRANSREVAAASALASAQYVTVTSAEFETAEAGSQARGRRSARSSSTSSAVSSTDNGSEAPLLCLNGPIDGTRAYESRLLEASPGTPVPPPPAIPFDFRSLTQSPADTLNRANSEAFVTPPSSPTHLSESEEELSVPTTPMRPGNTSGASAANAPGYDSMPSVEPEPLDHDLPALGYDFFSVDLRDVQVLAAALTDEWKEALVKSTSPLHVVDRFTVHCNISRCNNKELLAQIQPDAPSARIAARLPALTCSLSETKLTSLFRCLQRPPSSVPVPAAQENQESAAAAALKRRIRDMDRRLTVANFAIDAIRLEVFCGQAELSKLVGVVVSGVDVSLQQRPFDETLKFSIRRVAAEDCSQAASSAFRTLIAADGTADQPFLRVTYTHLLTANVAKVRVCVCECV